MTIKERIPPALLAPCPPNWWKDGGPADVGDLVDRGNVNGLARDVCAAQLGKVAEWDKQ